MAKADDLRAALKVAELEEQLVAAKAAGEDYYELKHELRAARQAHRESRDLPADGEARPETIEAAAAVKGKD